MKDAKLRKPIVKQLTELTETGTPAMKARGKKLLTQLSAP